MSVITVVLHTVTIAKLHCLLQWIPMLVFGLFIAQSDLCGKQLLRSMKDKLATISGHLSVVQGVIDITDTTIQCNGAKSVAVLCGGVELHHIVSC